MPPDAAGEPLVVTFALTGLGEARIDEVSVRVLEHGGAGVAASPVSTVPQPAFPTPTDLLGGPAAGQIPRPAPVAPPPAAPPPRPPQWPGMSVGWPSLLPFGQAADAPPPGVGGGTVDPFKRARTAPSPAP